MSFSKTAKATAKVTEAYNVFPVKHLKDNNTANFEREWGENFFRQKKFSPHGVPGGFGRAKPFHIPWKESVSVFANLLDDPHSRRR